jgi:hypothetical protein
MEGWEIVLEVRKRSGGDCPLKGTGEKRRVGWSFLTTGVNAGA